MARFAFRVNETTENIGARRLHTIMERVLDEISFLAPDLNKAAKNDANVIDIAASAENNGATTPLPIIERETANGREKVAIIDPEYVRNMVSAIVKDQDLSRYIL